jgi:glycosyltransferase involved in cell wall biosynthesis
MSQSNLLTAPASHAADPPTHLVLIPSYNTGEKLAQTVAEALHHWPHVCVVIDGSTDGSDKSLNHQSPGLQIIRRSRNGGKGAAVLDGIRAAKNFTHVLVMDADGQHSAPSIPEFMEISHQHPQAMILGEPVFDGTAPKIRRIARPLANALARLQTAGCSRIGDSLFGFRIYPRAELLAVMESTAGMRKFDFDTEAAIRLAWRGVPAINLPAPVRYFSAAEGGVSHFRYGRDNLRLAAMHLRLLSEILFRGVRSCRR